MIRVAICAKDNEQRLMLRAMTERLATHVNVPCLETRQFLAPEDVLDHFQCVRPGFVDIAIILFDEGIQDEDLLDRIVQAGGGTRIVVVSPRRSDAALAYAHEARFLFEGAGAADFVRVMKLALDLVVLEHAKRIMVKSKTGIDSLLFERVLFVETSGGGLLVHLPDEKTLELRSTLQALFERLAVDKRFVKAGSSFIVNLDNVRSMGSGSVIFAGGDAIIVPVRARRPLQEAFDEYRGVAAL